jgi:hypothetical protein
MRIIWNDHLGGGLKEDKPAAIAPVAEEAKVQAKEQKKPKWDGEPIAD